MKDIDLTHHFLIAMPNMADPHFAKTVTYICEHGAHGALGLVINRPTDINLATLFKQIDLPLEDHELGHLPVHFGGPVHGDRGFVLHTPSGDWKESLSVQGGMALTTSKDVLEAVGRGEGPDKFFITLGYAGWSPGQLEHELAQNAWLTVGAQSEVIFDLPDAAKLDAAMHLLGIDFSRLSEQVGHA
ncbi:MAG: YqgE/AlgH family protein [Betaproteobacteria bacterium]|jgi:putative transcriptional regulator|nr:YqgE/AlgH family protein [Betaproteobacteria bacterium]